MTAAVSAMLRVVLLLPGSSLGDLDSFLIFDGWMFDSVGGCFVETWAFRRSAPLLAAFTTMCDTTRTSNYLMTVLF